MTGMTWYGYYRQNKADWWGDTYAGNLNYNRWLLAHPGHDEYFTKSFNFELTQQLIFGCGYTSGESGGDCNDNGTYVSWTMTVSGVTGTGCSTRYNGNWTLTNSGNLCRWTSSTSAEIWRLQWLSGGGGWVLNAYDPTTTTVVQYQSTTGGADWNCLTSNTLNLEFSFSCSGWPATITLTPVTTQPQFVPPNDDTYRTNSNTLGESGSCTPSNGYDFLCKGNYIHPTLMLNNIDGSCVPGGLLYYAGDPNSFNPTIDSITRYWLEVLSTDDLETRFNLVDGNYYFIDVYTSPCAAACDPCAASWQLVVPTFACSISYIQSNSNTAVTSSPITTSFSSNVTAGNAIIVAISHFDPASVSVTDNLGNSYTQIGSASGTSNFINLWLALNISGGACTVTVTPNTTAFFGIGIHEYNNIAGVDNVVGNTGTSNTPSPGSISVSNTNDMAFSACGQGAFNQTAPTTVNNGFTIRIDEPNGATFESLATADLIPSSSNVTPTFTLTGGSSEWVAVGASFFCKCCGGPYPSGYVGTYTLIADCGGGNSCSWSFNGTDPCNGAVCPVWNLTYDSGSTTWTLQTFCQTITTCDMCTSTTTLWNITVSGVTGSSDCTAHNGTFQLVYGGGCTWFCSYPGTDNVLWELAIFDFDPVWRLTAYDSSTNPQQSYSFSGTWNCTGSNVINADTNFSCGGWPSTITVNSTMCSSTAQYTLPNSSFNCLSSNVLSLGTNSGCTWPSTLTLNPIVPG